MGELEQDLAAHTVIGVDTAPFIYLWERHSRYFASPYVNGGCSSRAGLVPALGDRKGRPCASQGRRPRPGGAGLVPALGDRKGWPYACSRLGGNREGWPYSLPHSCPISIALRIPL